MSTRIYLIVTFHTSKPYDCLSNKTKAKSVICFKKSVRVEFSTLCMLGSSTSFFVVCCFISGLLPEGQTSLDPDQARCFVDSVLNSNCL